MDPRGKGLLGPDERGPACCPVCRRIADNGDLPMQEHTNWETGMSCVGVGRPPIYLKTRS